MSKRKTPPSDDGNTDHLGFTDMELAELFQYTTQNKPTISISVLRPLFSAIDDLFAEFEIFRARDELSQKTQYGEVPSIPCMICYQILSICFHAQQDAIITCIKNMWLSKLRPVHMGNKHIYFDASHNETYRVTSNHSYGVYLYRCTRRVVFATNNNVLLDLESITKYNRGLQRIEMDRFSNPIEDIIPALVGLVLWRDCSIYYQIQALQQSHLQHERKSTHKFTDLLRPLCCTVEMIEKGLSDPPNNITLFSSRKRCTKQQMKLLRDNMHGDTDKTMNSTLQSFMSTSTSKRFCTQFHFVNLEEEECDYEMPPMLLTITVEPHARKLRVFIPVYWYLIERETCYSTREYEVLLFPGVKMEFRNLQCQPEQECGPKDTIMTMDAKIVGFEPDKSALDSTPHTGCQISYNQIHTLAETISNLILGSGVGE
jgi:hypothetical protein